MFTLIVLLTYTLLIFLGHLYGEITLGTLLWTSFVLANAATWLRSLLRLNRGFSNNEVNDGTPSKSGNKGSMKKAKRSGDEHEWEHSRAIKV
jgi:hypothetical protein